MFKRVSNGLAAVALSTALATPVAAYDMPPCENGPLESAVGPSNDPARRPPTPDRAGPPGDMRGGPLRLAAHLAALETYIGITTAQLDAWRAYTDALQAALAAPSAEPPEDNPPGATPRPGRPPHGDAQLPGEEMARQMEMKGAQARRLSAAIDGLRSQLTPEQFDRLRNAGRFHLPLPRPASPADQAPPPDRPAEVPGADHT